MATTEAHREDLRRVIRDWTASLDALIERDGPEAARDVLAQVERRAAAGGVPLRRPVVTPPVNTIAPSDEQRVDGDAELDARIEALVRWNAAAMVVRANRRSPGIGGHVSTFASAATLFEVGFQHLFGARDRVYLQGHASPGVYARAFLEGRLSEQRLEDFRRELQPSGGLSSYPHPWLMPDFWSFPSVSMGLAPLMAIHQARFDRYLRARGLVEDVGRVWAVVGDGEMDEPESTGALALAAREGLSNLVFVVNANLQRLDGPVRGNGSVVRELEGRFAGAGWRVVKVLWNGAWDALFDADVDGRLVERLAETVDGDWQRLWAGGPSALRDELFGDDPALRALIDGWDDADLARLGPGGHDPRKVAAAYLAARDEPDRPTVILAQTVKGRGLGDAGEALNIAHKAKALDVEALTSLRDELGLEIDDEGVEDAVFVRPDDDSPELAYMRERREALGGPLPARVDHGESPGLPDGEAFDPLLEGSDDDDATTTAMLVRLLSHLLDDERVGERLVPIVPDEARTFGLEALFPKVGIYAAHGQRYEPVDADTLVSYSEREDGQILEEGITEAGSMASFIAAGTSYATHAKAMVPFYLFYSQFGFQRVGDLVWAAQDSRARGFLVGATAGRTTLNGEGLQHQDGHSHLTALAHPSVRAYDPAFGYEVAVIVEDGLRRMLDEGRDEIVYLTTYNEGWRHPELPDGAREGILRGAYRLRASERSGDVRRARLLASGSAVPWALEAQRMLEERGVTVDVWSVTSWQQLHRDAAAAERAERLGSQAPPRSWFDGQFGDDDAPIVAVTDSVRALPDVLAHRAPGRWTSLGTDGFGRSDTRAALRDHFEVDARWITLAALSLLAQDGRIADERVADARAEFGVTPVRTDPARA